MDMTDPEWFGCCSDVPSSASQLMKKTLSCRSYEVVTFEAFRYSITCIAVYKGNRRFILHSSFYSPLCMLITALRRSTHLTFAIAQLRQALNLDKRSTDTNSQVILLCGCPSIVIMCFVLDFVQMSDELFSQITAFPAFSGQLPKPVAETVISLLAQSVSRLSKPTPGPWVVLSCAYGSAKE